LELRRQASRHHTIVYQKLTEAHRILTLRSANRRVFFDFDDAIYLQHPYRFALAMMASYGVIAGNALLAEHARRYNRRVTVVPTVVPMPSERPPAPAEGPFVFSWLGTSDNLRYLEPVFAALGRLRETMDVVLDVVTERPENVPTLPGVRVAPWSLHEENQAFARCHAGLMPLVDDAWSRGKCACKALQYLSYGRPVVSSPVGVNAEILHDQSFAWLASTPQEWEQAMRVVVGHRSSLHERGDAGAKFVAERYAYAAWAGRFAELLFS